MVQRFVDDRDIDATLNIGGADMRKINFCFKYLKELYLSKSKQESATTANNQQSTVHVLEASFYDTKETKDLKDTLKQRDNEISILVNMLKKEKKRASEIADTKPPIYRNPNETQSDTNELLFGGGNKPQKHKTRQICNTLNY